jgi:imidazolonepropionase-like amidohydrolase
MRSIQLLLVAIAAVLTTGLLNATVAQTEPEGRDADASSPAVTLVEGATLRVDGQWVQRDFFIVDDTIRWGADRAADDTLRFPGHYITPGFADAHTHNLDRPWQRSYVDRYLSEGTLVVQNLTSKSEGTRAFRAYMEDIPSPIVRYANWGFTSTLGHPFLAYEPYAMGLDDPSTWQAQADSIAQSRVDLYNAYAFVDSVAQLESIWPRFLETDPDVVKIYYFNEEGIEAQRMGGHGLRREVAEAIIDSAHAHGLDAYAHVETRRDVERMLDADVDGLAHMPGYSWDGDSTTVDKYFLPDGVLQQAARQDVVIIPTATLNAYSNQGDSTAIEAAAAFQIDLIRRYRQMGGPIAAGSDVFASTGAVMYTYYAEHIDLPPGEKLDLLTTETTEAILPDVQTGRIAEGYAASFLVFRDRPFVSDRWRKPAHVYLNGENVAENAAED